MANATDHPVSTFYRLERSAARYHRSRSCCSQKCCARPARAGSAHHPSPSTLPATKPIVVSDMTRQSKSFAQRKRGKAAVVAAQSAQNRWKTHAWPAVMTPMHAMPPAPEAAARQTAGAGHIASIKPARTCGLCTTRGATAVSPACCANPSNGHAGDWRR